MGVVVPKNRGDIVAFYEAHLAAWAANAEAIGLDPAAVAAFAGHVQEAADAGIDAEAARDASVSATFRYHDRVGNVTRAGAVLMRRIRAHAATTGDPQVYVRALIPPPSPRSPIPAPGTPTRFAVTLLGGGVVVLRWACPNPTGSTGTLYEVMRRSGVQPAGDTRFEMIGSTGRRVFADHTTPSGTPLLTYRVTAVRSTARGNPGFFTVCFGNTPGKPKTVMNIAA